MNLEFPTDLPVPLYLTRPAGEVEAGACASLEELGELLQHPFKPGDSDPAGFHVDDVNPEVAGHSGSVEFTQEAIGAIIRNIAAHPTKGEYVWDPVQERWVLRVVPI